MALRKLYSLGAVFDFQDRGSRKIRGLNDELQKAHGSLQDVLGDTTLLGATGPQLAAIGAGLTAMGAGILYGVKRATDSVIPLNRELDQVTTLLSEQERALLPQSSVFAAVTALAAEYGRESEALARGLFQVKSAGVETGQMLDVLEVATKTSVSSNADLVSVVDGLTSVLNAYGTTGLGVASQLDGARKVADLFFETNRLGKTTVEELSRSLGTLAPAAVAAGVSLEDALAAVAATTAQGIDTRRSTTFLAQALSNVIKPSAEASKAARRLGIDFSTAALQSEGLVAFLANVKLAAGEDQRALADLFGSVEAFKAVSALTSAEGAQKFATAAAAMAGAAGSVERAFGTVAAGDAFQIDRLGQSARSLWQTIGQALLPLRGAVSGFFADIFDGIRQWAQANPAVVRGLTTAAVALGAALVTVGGALVGIGGFLGTVAALGAFGPVLAAAAAVAVKVGLVLVPVIAAVGAGVGLLVARWGDFVEGLRQTGALEAVGNLLGSLRGLFGQLGATVGGFFGAMSDGGSAAGTVIKAIGVALGGLLRVGAAVASFFVKSWTLILRVLEPVARVMGAITGSVAGVLARVPAALFGGGAGAAGVPLPGAPNAASPLADVPGGYQAAAQRAGVASGEVVVRGGQPVAVSVGLNGREIARGNAIAQLEADERVREVSPAQRDAAIDGY